MNPIQFVTAGTSQDAVRLARHAGHRFLGGGTNLVDLMRQNLEQPSALIDVSGLSTTLEERADGSVLIGAGVRNSAVASHPAVRARFPLLARAVLSGASAQIRNMATVGGNLLQRTRCAYFYDHQASRCNKRAPGSGCDAMEGFHRYHAILGASPLCIATHPSDMCVALVALESQVHITGPFGNRTVPMREFHLLPGDRPDLETALAPGELIVSVEIPPLPSGTASTYRKVRDRASYAFALVSVAACLKLEGTSIVEVRLALGGVGAKPWRALSAEALLQHRPATPENFAAAAVAALADATPLAGNSFKVELAQRTMIAVLTELAGGQA